MGKKYYRLNTGSIAAAGEKTDKYTAEEDYTLEGILLSERGAGTLENVQVYADIGGAPIFRPDVPGIKLDTLYNQMLPIGWAFKKGALFNYKITNGSAAAVDIDIVLVLGPP